MSKEYSRVQIIDESSSIHLIHELDHWVALIIYVIENKTENLLTRHIEPAGTKVEAYERAVQWYRNNINNNAEIEPLN